jgi:hypothetical protein
MLIFLKPPVQVNRIPDRAPAEFDRRRPDLQQQRHADAEIRGSLLLGEAANMRQGQSGFIVHAAIVATAERECCDKPRL